MTVVQKTIKEITAALRANFSVFRDNKPLAIGTKVELEGFSKADIQRGISRHVSTSTYLRNVKFGTHRYNLDGSQAEEIKPEHQELSRLKLNVRHVHRTWNSADRTGLSKKSLAKKQANYFKRVLSINTKLETAVSALKGNNVSN